MQVEELTWLLRNAQQSTLQTARLALLPASALYQLRLAPDDVNRLLKVLEHKGPIYDGRTFRELVERELSELRDHVDVDGRYEATGEDHRIIPARHPRDRAVSFNRQGRADELMPAFPLLPMEHEDGIYLLDPPEASDLIVEQRPWDWSYRSARETRARQRYRGDEPSGTIDQRWYRAHARAADVPELVDARIRWLEDVLNLRSSTMVMRRLPGRVGSSGHSPNVSPQASATSTACIVARPTATALGTPARSVAVVRRRCCPWSLTWAASAAATAGCHVSRERPYAVRAASRVTGTGRWYVSRYTSRRPRARARGSTVRTAPSPGRRAATSPRSAARAARAAYGGENDDEIHAS